MRGALPFPGAWRILPLLLPLLSLWACGAGSGTPPADTPPDWTRGRSLGGTYDLSWRPEIGAIESNEPTTLRVEVRRAGTGDPVEGAEIVMRGTMPGHGHGMNRDPRSRELGGGEYLVEGVLLHMSGHWELKFDVVADGVAETTAFELELE